MLQKGQSLLQTFLQLHYDPIHDFDSMWTKSFQFDDICVAWLVDRLYTASIDQSEDGMNLQRRDACLMMVLDLVGSVESQFPANQDT